MHGLSFKQMIGYQLIKAGRLLLPEKNIVQSLQWNNPIGAQLFVGGRLIQTVGGHNGVTVVGKNHILDVYFGNATPVTQIDPWYIGLIKQSPTPVLSENDTLASHAGWTEATGYSGNRKEWDDADAASKIKGTTAASTFVFTGDDTIHGLFIASAATGTTGILWATGSFDTPVAVTNTAELKITYGLRC